jgi:hypothetical protein
VPDDVQATINALQGGIQPPAPQPSYLDRALSMLRGSGPITTSTGVNITPQDINTGVDLGLNFSGGGLATRPPRKYFEPGEAYQAYRQSTEASRIKDKEANAAIRSTRDAPIPDFPENTAENTRNTIDALIGKWKSGTITDLEQLRLKQMLHDRYK